MVAVYGIAQRSPVMGFRGSEVSGRFCLLFRPWVSLVAAYGMAARYPNMGKLRYYSSSCAGPRLRGRPPLARTRRDSLVGKVSVYGRA